MSADYSSVPLVIPALNPDNRIHTFIRSLREFGFDTIIVVGDGSDELHKDGVFRELNEQGEVVLLRNYHGKGVALKDGLSYVNEHFPDCIGVVTADYDGRQSAASVRDVAAKLLEGEKFVLGTRDIAGSNISKKMRRGYKLVEWTFRILYSKKIKDIQTGLRGISKELLARFIEIKGNRYEYEPRMIVEAVREDIPICEVEVGAINPIDAGDETIEISDNYHPFSDSIKIALSLFLYFIKYAVTSISATAIDFALFYILSSYVFNNMELGICVFLSTVLARAVSSTISFMVNRKLVFKADGRIAVRNVLLYYALVTVIMLSSAELVTLFVRLLGGGKTFTKLFVDLILFFVSYQIQNRVIFKKDKK